MSRFRRRQMLAAAVVPGGGGGAIVGYGIVGTPSIVDGVLSVSDKVSGVVCPEPFSPGTESWEIVTRVRQTSPHRFADLLYSLDSNNAPIQYLLLEAGSGGEMYFYARLLGESSWSLIRGVSTPYGADNSWCFLRLRYDKDSGYYVGNSTDGIAWSESQAGIVTPIQGGAYITFGYVFGDSNYFPGEWDLNETYIKIGGSV